MNYTYNIIKRKLGFIKELNNPTPKKHRVLDLRNMEQFLNFNMYKCVYKIHSDPVNSTCMQIPVRKRKKRQTKFY